MWQTGPTFLRRHPHAYGRKRVLAHVPTVPTTARPSMAMNPDSSSPTAHGSSFCCGAVFQTCDPWIAGARWFVVAQICLKNSSHTPVGRPCSPCELTIMCFPCRGNGSTKATQDSHPHHRDLAVVHSVEPSPPFRHGKTCAAWAQSMGPFFWR